MTIFITGGAGFIGSHFAMNWLSSSQENIINIDTLTYAANLDNLTSVIKNPQHQLIKSNIGDSHIISQLCHEFQPRAIINFAAETHVDRSIDTPQSFVQTNIVDTFSLLETIRHYWQRLAPIDKESFRFIHISTDEVYGSLEAHQPAFTEQSPYCPNSPYSASKAASDHLCRAYHKTYGVPCIITHASNNYGPQQYPEKLIPRMLYNALLGNPLPLYGDGQQIRDWLYVVDHCLAIRCILEKGIPGETYNIGGQNELSNLFVVNRLCELLDQIKPNKTGTSYREQITFVNDRPAHDQRYALDNFKIENALGWHPIETFESGLLKTVTWYLTAHERLNNIAFARKYV